MSHSGDTTTLGKLCSLTDDRFKELLDNGTIHPNMGRDDMAVPGPLKSPWSAISPPGALRSHPAADRATAALSGARPDLWPIQT